MEADNTAEQEQEGDGVAMVMAKWPVRWAGGWHALNDVSGVTSVSLNTEQLNIIMDHVRVVGRVKELIYYNTISIFGINDLCVFTVRIISTLEAIIYSHLLYFIIA